MTEQVDFIICVYNSLEYNHTCWLKQRESLRWTILWVLTAVSQLIDSPAPSLPPNDG